jgi:hypothetical protein
MSNCNCRKCVGQTEIRSFVVAATPVTVTLERIDADDVTGEPDRLGLMAFRGETRLGSTEIERGESLHPEMGREWLLSDNERDQISAVVIAEWIAWPVEQEPKGEPAPQLTPDLLAQFEALKVALS